MTRSARLLALLLLSACSRQGSGNVAAPVEAREPMASGPSIPPPGPLPAVARTRDDLTTGHATIVTELRRQLVGRATLDGASISDVQAVDACHTAFVTAAGRVTIDWGKGGNIAARDVGGREVNDLPGTDGPHPLSMPAGDGADGISGAVGLLVSECS